MGSRKIKRRAPKSRVVKMNAESMAIIETQIQKFRERFGREPGPKDPIFFDPEALTPQPFRLDELLQESTEAMAQAGIRPEIIYAHRKTGLIITEDNLDKIPKDALAEWEAAIAEYFETVKGKIQ
ncbi:MAG: hypothetical protein LAQ69_30190 [Acidobacteriia bacterium]|nr:hypothetical protein [Terriglobia bacterium]